MTVEPRTLGPFRVSVDAERARAYRQETGGGAATDGAAPFAYPAVWFSAPQIRGAIAQVCAARDSVPVHESQRFSYTAPLRAGVDYDLAVTLRQEETPPRLIIDAVVRALSGEPLATIETMLRLVPRSGFALGARS